MRIKKNNIKIAIILFICILNINLKAQTPYGCGNEQVNTNTNTKYLQCTGASLDYLNQYKHKEQYIPHESNIIIKTLHINFNIWQRHNGTGNLLNNPQTIARLKGIASWINDKYEYNQAPASPPLPYSTESIDDSKIRIVLDSIYFYIDPSTDSSYYYGGYGSATYGHNILLDSYIKTNFPERTRSLNIHLTGSIWPNIGGYSDYGSIESFFHNNPPMDTSTVHDYWFAEHWAHEIGHSFDLWHTYNVGWDQNCDNIASDFLWDVYDTTNHCEPSCHICLIPASSSNNNLMGGGSNIHISALQMGIMHRSTVLENFHNSNYGLRDHITGYSTIPYEIVKNEIWDFSMKFYQNLIVKTGYTLTIKCEIQFVPNAKIIIETGGKLIIDGGKLTNEKYYNSMWKGIEVWGTSNQTQYGSNSPYQGKVEVINGGSIENAEVAVFLGKRDSQGLNISGFEGGIITATNASFKNNKEGVVFKPYHNFLPTNHNLTPNLSQFKTCNFETNTAWNFVNIYPVDFVNLTEVEGVIFNGCTFQNTVPANFAVYNRGKGIVSTDAYFTIDDGCASLMPCPSPIHCSFSNLYYAIDAKKTWWDYALSIKNATFNSNYRGIYISGILTPTITNNTFSIPNYDAAITVVLPTDNQPYGLYLNESTGYIVENNAFNNSTSSQSNKFGAIINNSGSANNRIYNNTFTNLYIGSSAQGNNRGSGTGFVFKCNEYTNCHGDISMSPYNRFYGAASLYQGSPTEPAANLFSHTGSTRTSDFYDESWVVNYYHSTSATPIPRWVPKNYSTTVALYNTNIPYNKLTQCPISSGSGGGGSTSKNLANSYQIIHDLSSNIALIENQLTILVDGGNTPMLVNEVAYSPTWDALNLRNSLLNKSPFLSDTVLASTVENESAMPPLMLTQVLKANPQAIKSEEVKERIENRQNAIPEYLMNEIENTGKSFSAKEHLESKALMLRNKRAVEIYSLIT